MKKSVKTNANVELSSVNNNEAVETMVSFLNKNSVSNPSRWLGKYFVINKELLNDSLFSVISNLNITEHKPEFKTFSKYQISLMKTKVDFNIVIIVREL